ncbi:MAG TPA: tail fiber domain-containing protein, partial [Candidatus Dojkabacteria bacterium]|nr:tail fiber domain-containing protein [Candidatus Dojkabacteria bacterium]
RIARINSDGSLDTTFNPGSGANDTVTSLAIQTDGKIVIGGNFTTYNGTARNRIARINSDGSLDTTFDPGSGANDTVSFLAIQADGKIVIGGNFTTYNNASRGRIARLLISVLYNPYENSFLVGFGSSRMYIDNTKVNFLGNSVGINLSDPLSPPSAMLAVRGITSDSTAAALKITNLSDDSLLFVRNDGNVGIGVTSPTYRLQLPNTADNAGKGQANAWVTYSDISLKENIQTITGGLDKIMALRGVTFDWKGQGVASSGFIAQEVELVIPDLVSTDSNGIKSLDYGRFTPYLVEAIKEQQLQIQTAYQRITQLENSNIGSKSIVITTPGWYRISKLNTNDDHSNIKINNTSIGSSQNIVLSIDSTLNNQNINIVSNLTTGGYDITKARINNENGIKYLEIYIPEVNENKISVKITESSNWIATDIVQITEEVNNTQEYALSGILFGISDKLEVKENNVKIAGDLLSLSVNSSIGDSANRWNDIYAKGTIRIGSGTDGEGAIRFNVEKKVLEFSNNGVEWLSVGDLSSQMTISPEYAGAILFADGSDNSG